MNELDNCDQGENIRARIQSKESLARLYNEFYYRYAHCIKKCPADGIVLEIGSGAGLLKNIVPNVVTTDILSYKTVDMIMDASRLPFSDNAIKSIFLLNTLHHISNSKSFFHETVRCLKPGGRILIIDKYHGWFSNLIYKYFHHEPFDPKATNWGFESSDPLSGANGALCWMIFYRDRHLFKKYFPSLEIVKLSPNTPFRYWLSGGLKSWTLLPGSLFQMSTRLDNWLSQNIPSLCSVVDVELVKQL